MPHWTLCFLSVMLASCASAPFPGDERITDGPEFDAKTPAPTDGNVAAGTAGKVHSRSRPDAESTRNKSLADAYVRPPAAGPDAKVLLERHNQKCRATQVRGNVVIAGRAVLDGPGRHLLGPFELTLESGGRFLERMTLAASADDLDYGEGVESERGFDGSVAWRKDARMGSYFVDDVEKQVFSVDARLFVGRFDDVLKNLQTMGELEFGGFPAYRVQGRTGQGELFELYFHRDTSFLLGRAHLDPDQPEDVLSKATFFDISAQAGLCVPKRVELKAGEEKQVLELAAPRRDVKRAAIAPPPELKDIGDLEGP